MRNTPGIFAELLTSQWKRHLTFGSSQSLDPFFMPLSPPPSPSLARVLSLLVTPCLAKMWVVLLALAATAPLANAAFCGGEMNLG